MKKSLTSLELAALTNELQSLTNSRISQVYHQDNELLFQLHTKQGKQFLRILPGSLLNLTQTKTTYLKPSSFCMQLRKHLNNAFIREIKQKNTERILILEIEKKEPLLLIIELFAPGNLILAQTDYQTIACLHQKKFKDRFIRPKTKYQFPPPANNWKTLTETKLTEILKKSQKKNLAASLATEIGLGGLYAEEICKLTNTNKNQSPQELEKHTYSSIIKTIKELLELIKKPQGFIYDNQITPFPLTNQKEKQKTKTYSQALDTLKSAKLPSPYEKKISAVKRTLQQQEEAVQEQENNIKINNQKAELIYQKYQPLNKLLTITKELKKTKPWNEIKKELQKEKKIKKIDLKNKKIIINL